ncbi:ABC transporter ATP-binding protein [Blautia liquoris]|uniref:Nickel import system ATP-binding protein NikD n=1 Tax=Blautia liquoris TaxID=2779518 RepID=A0A7M2RI70_9FIRM|nr:ABC transporter ATP-binding protein [Blautia liquoris]QOV19741.1 ABC transporter ATP-binding protein [Blautia liquoris]
MPPKEQITSSMKSDVFGEISLKIEDLCVDFLLSGGDLRAVYHLDFELPAHKMTGLVGESGSGKTTLTSAILRSVSTPGEITQGKIFFENQDVLKLSDEKLRRFRWNEIAMVFQAAQNSLNPSMTIQEQFAETIMAHRKNISNKEMMEISRKLLKQVKLEPERILRSYPHELSGGMKQRVMIAFAQLLDPPVLLLDEPTTALDVITQDYIFTLIKQMHDQTHNTMLLSTHDIAIVARVCDYMAVMYGGRIVEMGDIFTMFESPLHPYTQMLIKAAPSLVGELKERVAIPGSAPDLMKHHEGCIFADRCPYCYDRCQSEEPKLKVVGEEHLAACHRADIGKEGR